MAEVPVTLWNMVRYSGAPTAPLGGSRYRLSFDTPVLLYDGRRLGRLSRLAVEPGGHVAGVIVHPDGPGGREVLVPADCIKRTNEGVVQTCLDDTAARACTPLFVRQGRQTVRPESSLDHLVCLDRYTRLWEGPRCLGRLEAFVFEGRRLIGLEYVAGLYFPTVEEIDVESVRAWDDARLLVSV